MFIWCNFLKLIISKANTRQWASPCLLLYNFCTLTFVYLVQSPVIKNQKWLLKNIYLQLHKNMKIKRGREQSIFPIGKISFMTKKVKITN